MTVMLSLEQSLAYLEGNYPAYLVELDVLENLWQRNIAEPVAVVLVDGVVAFYCVNGEII